MYRIANARGLVGSFCINKTSYKLGEDIVAGFDFTEGTVPCLQISVCLQAEEQIADEYRKRQIHNHITKYVNFKLLRIFIFGELCSKI